MTNLSWRQKAACRGLDPEIFYPTSEDDAEPAKVGLLVVRGPHALPGVRPDQPRARRHLGRRNREGTPAHRPAAPQVRLTSRCTHDSRASARGLVVVSAMMFELPDELIALQESVRRLAQDKVRPRAREIDETGEYPAGSVRAVSGSRSARAVRAGGGRRLGRRHPRADRRHRGGGEVLEHRGADAAVDAAADRARCSSPGPTSSVGATSARWPRARSAPASGCPSRRRAAT